MDTFLFEIVVRLFGALTGGTKEGFLAVILGGTGGVLLAVIVSEGKWSIIILGVIGAFIGGATARYIDEYVPRNAFRKAFHRGIRTILRTFRHGQE